MGDDSPADVLLSGGSVVVGDPAAGVVEQRDIRVHAGRIEAIDGAITRRPDDQVVDCRGHLVIPGLINLHTHAMLTMVRGVAEDLGTAPAYTPGVPHASDLRADEARAFARLGLLEALLFGSTTVVDAYVHAEEAARAAEELGIRAWVGQFIHDVSFDRLAEGDLRHDPGLAEASLRSSLELVDRFHGAADGRIQTVLNPHAPDTCSAPLLARVAEAAAARQLSVTTHLAQSRAEVERVGARDGHGPVDALDRAGLLDQRMIAAHGMYLRETDLRPLARPTVTIAHVPKGNATGGRLAPTAMLRDAGVRLGLATDNMHADMIEVLRWALVTGRVQAQGVDARWQPTDVLAMATTLGAAALGVDADLGRIEVGYQADLVALDMRSPHLTPLLRPIGSLVHVAQGRDVAHVVVAGRVVVRDGRSTLVDQDIVRAEAAQAAAELWARTADVSA